MIIRTLILISIIFTSAWFLYYTSDSSSYKMCNQLINVAKNQESADFVKSWALAFLNDKKSMEFMANIGGIYSSYENRTFNQLKISFDWSKIGVTREDVYVGVHGNWRGKDGIVDMSKIKAVSVGVSRRQFIAVSIGNNNLDVKSVNKNSKVKIVHEENGLSVFCSY